MNLDLSGRGRPVPTCLLQYFRLNPNSPRPRIRRLRERGESILIAGPHPLWRVEEIGRVQTLDFTRKLVRKLFGNVKT